MTGKRYPDRTVSASTTTAPVVEVSQLSEAGCRGSCPVPLPSPLSPRRCSPPWPPIALLPAIPLPHPFSSSLTAMFSSYCPPPPPPTAPHLSPPCLPNPSPCPPPSPARASEPPFLFCPSFCSTLPLLSIVHFLSSRLFLPSTFPHRHNFPSHLPSSPLSLLGGGGVQFLQIPVCCII